SESIPSSTRGRLVLSAFGFQALGALTGTVVGYVILENIPDIGAWRWMYATAIVPALIVTIGRFFVTESPQWLHAHGRSEEAARRPTRLLQRTPPYPRSVRLGAPAAHHAAHRGGHAALFSAANRRATILASVPWFLQDLATYGIGIFTPTILAATVGHPAAHPRHLSDLVGNDMLAAKGAALIDILLIVGIVVAVLLADKAGRIALQVFGFIGCAAGLLLAALSANFAGGAQIALIFAGFMLFNLMTN